MGTACAIVNEFLCLDFLTLNSTRWIFNSLRMAIKREREEVHIAKQYLCRGLYSTRGGIGKLNQDLTISGPSGFALGFYWKN